MTKEQLEQLTDLKQEIKELEGKIVELNSKKVDMVTDKVKSSGKYFPYIQGSACVSGYDMQAHDQKIISIDRCIDLIARRKRKAEKLEEEITEYINSIDNSRVRRIMQYRYVEGYTWGKISKIMHCDRTLPEKIISRYIQEH